MNTDTITNKKKLKKLYEKHEVLLSRIVGVSDQLLSEQLREEYHLLENEIKRMEKSALDDIFIEMKTDLINYYKEQKKSTSKLTDIISVPERYRLPKNLNDRRSFVILADILHKNIRFVDLENITIDCIDKNYKEWITIGFYYLSRFEINPMSYILQ